MPDAKLYDVAVIGGGITGAGILRDCALRGLSAVLFDKAAPGRATTAASTHLIHGGLRYLLYDRLTTHATSWDAGNIVRITGSMLTRLPIIWPLYSGQRHGPETVETLIKAYEPFQRMKGGLPHLRFGPGTATELVGGLRRDGLLGAVSFDEWWVDAVALVEKNLAAAKGLGAEVLAHAEVTQLLRDSRGKVRGVEVRGKDGGLLEFSAKVVINAAGPWVDIVGKMGSISIPLRLRKGTHLVYDRAVVPVGLLLEAADDERHVFVVPFPGGTLVGPTDLPAVNDPEKIETDAGEIRYLLDSVRRWLPNFPTDYSRTVVGARPILGQSGSEKLLSREYEIFDHAADAGVEGFLTVAGGKLSDFRLMAKDAVDLACQKLAVSAQCRTHALTLDGEPVAVIPNFPRPWPPLKRFLRRHPRLRELHALAWLGQGLITHLARKALGASAEADAAEFARHYGYSGARVGRV